MMMQLGGTTAATTSDTPVSAPVPALASTSNTADGGEHGNNGTGLVGPGDGAAMEESDVRGFGGNRWPRQETLALLKIRSDMDVAFRDATVKGPLWEEVSRKLAELGYNRSAKKCKEKFENVYKYHKRTKEGRTGKSEGKTYRFFDQLEALENQSQTHQRTHHKLPQLAAPPPPHQQSQPQPTGVVPSTMPIASITSPFPPPNVNVTPPPPQPPSMAPTANPTSAIPSVSGDFLTDSTSSSSTSSDLEVGKRKRKRKWKGFFERLMRQVVEKQEELQRRFLEAVEKREHERMVREDAWRMQEMARINREREILAQERSMAAAKDAAVMAFLQKLSDQQQNLNPTNHNVPSRNQISPQIPHVRTSTTTNQNNIQSQNPNQNPPQPQHHSPPSQPQPVAAMNVRDVTRTQNEDQNIAVPTSSSRWPKVEIEALIRLRTSLDSKYQENGPKGPLWEEISTGMRRLGYNRSAKRCKEKWENINKYFKKVKESNRKRPEDSKTCPYFHQLEALYREKNKGTDIIKPENTVPLMVQPEQQWPPAPPPPPAATQSAAPPEHRPEMEREHFDDNPDDDEDDEDRDGGDHDEEEDDEEDGGEFEIVPNNKTVSLGTT